MLGCQTSVLLGDVERDARQQRRQRQADEIAADRLARSSVGAELVAGGDVAVCFVRSEVAHRGATPIR